MFKQSIFNCNNMQQHIQVNDQYSLLVQKIMFLKGEIQNLQKKILISHLSIKFYKLKYENFSFNEKHLRAIDELLRLKIEIRKNKKAIDQLKKQTQINCPQFQYEIQNGVNKIKGQWRKREERFSCLEYQRNLIKKMIDQNKILIYKLSEKNNANHTQSSLEKNIRIKIRELGNIARNLGKEQQIYQSYISFLKYEIFVKTNNQKINQIQDYLNVASMTLQKTNIVHQINRLMDIKNFQIKRFQKQQQMLKQKISLLSRQNQMKSKIYKIKTTRDLSSHTNSDLKSFRSISERETSFRSDLSLKKNIVTPSKKMQEFEDIEMGIISKDFQVYQDPLQNCEFRPKQLILYQFKNNFGYQLILRSDNIEYKTILQKGNKLKLDKAKSVKIIFKNIESITIYFNRKIHAFEFRYCDDTIIKIGKVTSENEMYKKEISLLKKQVIVFKTFWTQGDFVGIVLRIRNQSQSENIKFNNFYSNLKKAKFEYLQ